MIIVLAYHDHPPCVIPTSAPSVIGWIYPLFQLSPARCSASWSRCDASPQRPCSVGVVGVPPPPFPRYALEVHPCAIRHRQTRQDIRIGRVEASGRTGRLCGGNGAPAKDPLCSLAWLSVHIPLVGSLASPCALWTASQLRPSQANRGVGLKHAYPLYFPMTCIGLDIDRPSPIVQLPTLLCRRFLGSTTNALLFMRLTAHLPPSCKRVEAE